MRGFAQNPSHAVPSHNGASGHWADFVTQSRPRPPVTLGPVDVERAVLASCPTARSLYEVFTHAQSHWPEAWSAELVAAPGQALAEALRPGDVILQRAMGEGRMVSASLVLPSRPLDTASFAESVELGGGGAIDTVVMDGYGEAIGGPRPRRVVDGHGRVPLDRAIVRAPLAAEHQVSGASALTAGRVGTAVNGTSGTANIGLMSPSGAFPSPGPNTVATVTSNITSEKARFVTAFSTAGHTVDYTLASGHPTATHTDSNANYTLAGTDAQRLDSLVFGMFDASIQAGMAIRGGHGATRLLSSLAMQIGVQQTIGAFARMGGAFGFGGRDPTAPRRLVGYSDFTAITLTAFFQLNWAGLHGPMLTSTNAGSIATLVTAMTQPPASLYPGNQVASGLTVAGTAPSSSVRGVLIGGNLSLVHALYAGPSCPSLQGAILFIEEVGEDGRKIDRMLETLKHRGAAQQVRAVVVGRCSNINSAKVAGLVRNSWNVPVVSGLAAGHGSGGNLPLWIGLEHELQFPTGGGANLVLIP